MHSAFVARAKPAVPIWFVSSANWRQVRRSLGKRWEGYLDAVGFEPKPGRFLLLPGGKGVGGAVLGIEAPEAKFKDRFLPGILAELLPAGTYRFANTPHDPRIATLAFALGCYRFRRYRADKAKVVCLVTPDGVDGAELTRIVEAVTLARDLVNTPANDMGPDELETAARDLAKRHGAGVRTIEGEKLLGANYPLIHAVGRAAARAPRLIDVTWGDPACPKVTVVGKGVCFDTGGLNIKPETNMRLMKKDMGGAATALALAHMLMARASRVK